MIHETFVASDPKSAYTQAINKYGNDIKLVSAKQVQYEDGELRCEVRIAIPQKVFLESTLGKKSVEKEEETLLDEITLLKNQISQMREALQTQISEDNSVITGVKKLFTDKGISKAWLDKVINPLAGTPVAEDRSLLVSYCFEEIDEMLKVKKESLINTKVMMFVGPTGTGKTTTIAKLAARYSFLLERPYKVGLINLDSYKVGAVEQLSHYARIMQIEHIAVDTMEAFNDALDKMEEYDFILIDTAGMSPYDTKKFIRTVEYVNTGKQREFDINLVLPATVKYEDMEDIYENFSFLNLDSVVITKFDETRHLGALLNFMLSHPVAMSYFSIGQEVPDDLMVANKEYLLDRFIGDIDAG